MDDFEAKWRHHRREQWAKLIIGHLLSDKSTRTLGQARVCAIAVSYADKMLETLDLSPDEVMAQRNPDMPKVPIMPIMPERRG